MNESQLMTKKITTIGVGIAAMIAGGAIIYQISMFFPIPGFKYMMMAPYLSMILYLLISKMGTKSAVLHIGIVFGLIMLLVNVFMSVSIILTTVSTHLSIAMIIKPKKRAFVGAILFSTYTGVSSLLVSKYLIGGVFMQLSNVWIIFIGVICTAFGIVGTMLGRRMMLQLRIQPDHL